VFVHGLASLWITGLCFWYSNGQNGEGICGTINLKPGIELAELLSFETDYFVLADAERLPFKPESFDFFCSSGVLQQLGNLPLA